MTVANYKFISAVNELMLYSLSSKDDTSSVKENRPGHGAPVGCSSRSSSSIAILRQLKSSIVIALLSLLEGRSDRHIHHRLVQELNFDAIKDNIVDVYQYFEDTYKVNSILIIVDDTESNNCTDSIDRDELSASIGSSNVHESIQIH